ncbi:MAG: glycerophosphodiester phosphodiesterase family protein [Pseudomonadota bacterium]
MLLSPLALLDRWLAPAPDAARVGWLCGRTVAHRGLHGAGVPENSLKAFAAALERGLGMECDVHMSRDGWPVVFHDWELDRLTGETGPIGDRSAEQIGAIVLAGSTEGIPLLRQVLDLVAGRQPLLIEVKSRRQHRVGALCMALRRDLQGYTGPHAVMSFDPRVARWFAAKSPATVRGLVVSEEHAKTLFGRLRRHLGLWHARPDFLAYDVRDLPGRHPAAQRRRGMPVATWTVRSAADRERAAAHADALIVEGAGVP